MTVRDPQERQPLVQEDRRATPEHQAFLQALVTKIRELEDRVAALETP